MVVLVREKGDTRITLRVRGSVVVASDDESLDNPRRNDRRPPPPHTFARGF